MVILRFSEGLFVFGRMFVGCVKGTIGWLRIRLGVVM